MRLCSLMRPNDDGAGPDFGGGLMFAEHKDSADICFAVVCWVCKRRKTRADRSKCDDAQGAEPADAAADFMSQPFDWEHQWYPVAVVSDLDPGRHAFYLWRASSRL